MPGCLLHFLVFSVQSYPEKTVFFLFRMTSRYLVSQCLLLGKNSYFFGLNVIIMRLNSINRFVQILTCVIEHMPISAVKAALHCNDTIGSPVFHMCHRTYANQCSQSSPALQRHHRQSSFSRISPARSSL